MANYAETQLLVSLKSMARSNPIALDSSSVWDSYDEASAYASSAANAYAGQIITALVDDTFVAYMLQPSTSGYTLTELGADQSSLIQYVVVGTRPESGQEQGVIYIEDTTGYIWNGSEWVQIFSDVSSEISDYETRIGALEDAIDLKADLASPTFTGTIKLGEETVATQEYVESVIAQLNNGVPGIVDTTDNPLPTSDYTAGQMWRVTEEGTYAGEECEIGDLIICLTSYDSSYNDSDFLIIQGNIDGAVTGPDAATDANIVVFDGTTGKVIADSNVSIASLNDAIAKAHEHSNLATLETYTQTQTELLASAQSTAQGLVDTLSDSVDDALALKANAADVYTQTEIDNKLSVIETNLNTKLDSDAVDAKITTATETITEAYESAISTALGDIPEGYDIYTYIQEVLSTGSTESADVLASAKTYTDEAIEEALTVIEF